MDILVNPPFVESIINKTAQRIEQLLVLSDQYNRHPDQHMTPECNRFEPPPLSFAVTLPCWRGCEGIERLVTSRFRRPVGSDVLLLEGGKHNYRPVSSYGQS